MDLISDLAFGELSDFVIFFSGSLLNDKEDEFFDEDSIFTHIFKFPSIVKGSHFCGTFLDKFDSYMLGDNDLLPFQHRSLDTDMHIVVCSLMSTRFLINALDVLHSFTILGTGLKIDAIVGRINDMTMFFLREGLFFGQCSELCGAGHYSMPIVLEILPYYFFFWLS